MGAVAVLVVLALLMVVVAVPGTGAYLGPQDAAGAADGKHQDHGANEQVTHFSSESLVWDEIWRRYPKGDRAALP
ncbi:hypothetical protein JYT22_00735 [Endomicrobium sp. AH-315-J14]|nr:hypothetical protein [Endomicrobium sp. AH-315-J14]